MAAGIVGRRGACAPAVIMDRATTMDPNGLRKVPGERESSQHPHLENVKWGKVHGRPPSSLNNGHRPSNANIFYIVNLNVEFFISFVAFLVGEQI